MQPKQWWLRTGGGWARPCGPPTVRPANGATSPPALLWCRFTVRVTATAVATALDRETPTQSVRLFGFLKAKLADPRTRSLISRELSDWVHARRGARG